MSAATPNPDFDLKQSECVLPARTSVLAYIDDAGDLRIASDTQTAGFPAAPRHIEVRIPAEDVVDFIDRLTDLVDWPGIGAPTRPQGGQP